jgi:hypothetical protein
MRLFWFCVLGSAVFAVLLTFLGRDFSAKENAAGESFDVIAFELAGTPAQMAKILDTWGEDGIADARLQTRLDFLFLIYYGNAVALGVMIAQRRRESTALASLGGPLAWGAWIAALLDVVENVFLLRVLDGHLESPNPEIAYWCALVKFILLGLGIAYFLLGLLLPRHRMAPPTVHEA